MNPELQRKEEVRLRLLREIYRQTKGRRNCSVTIDDEVTDSIASTFDETVAAAEFLADEGLLKSKSIGGTVYSITHEGNVEIEESLRDPVDGTEHFAPAVIAIVSGSNNVIGSFQAGGTSNTATVNQSVTNTVTQRVVQELRDKVATLPPEQHDEVHSVIDQIEGMVEKGPKALAAIRMLITGLGTYFPHLIPWLSTQADLVARSVGGMLGG